MPSLCLAQRAAEESAAEEAVGEVMLAVAVLMGAGLDVPSAATGVGAMASPSSAPAVVASLSRCGILSEALGLVCALPPGVPAAGLLLRGGKMDVRCCAGVPTADWGAVVAPPVPVMDRLISGMSRLFLRGFVGDVASFRLSASREVNLLSAPSLPLLLLLLPPCCWWCRSLSERV